MNFKPCSIEEVKKAPTKGIYAGLVESFRASGAECARVDGLTASTGSAYSSLNMAARRAGDVRCIIQKGVIYLARVDALDKMEAAAAGQTDCVKL